MTDGKTWEVEDLRKSNWKQKFKVQHFEGDRRLERLIRPQPQNYWVLWLAFVFVLTIYARFPLLYSSDSDICHNIKKCTEVVICLIIHKEMINHAWMDSDQVASTTDGWLSYKTEASVTVTRHHTSWQMKNVLQACSVCVEVDFTQQCSCPCYRKHQQHIRSQEEHFLLHIRCFWHAPCLLEWMRWVVLVFFFPHQSTVVTPVPKEKQTIKFLGNPEKKPKCDVSTHWHRSFNRLSVDRKLRCKCCLCSWRLLDQC